MRCPSCGAEVVEEGVYCHRCGARLAGAKPPSEADPDQSPEAPSPSEASVPPKRERSDSSNFSPQSPLTAVSGRRSGETGEEELWQGGYSGKDMYEQWILYGLLSVVLIGVSVWGNVAWLWWFSAMLILVLWLRGMLVLAYRKLSVAYRLTSQRFFHEKGILRRTTDRVELIDIDDITVEQSIIDRLVGVGTIKITSSDRTHPVLVLPGIKDARHVADLMDNARLEERRRRGLHIEAV